MVCSDSPANSASRVYANKSIKAMLALLSALGADAEIRISDRDAIA